MQVIESLVIAGKETSLEVNAEKTKCMVMSPDENVGQNGNKQIDNKSFETVEQFKHLGTTLKIKIVFMKKLRAD